MYVLSTLICYLLIALGFISLLMGIVGLSLTPFISGGVLVGLGVLIYYIRTLPQALREVAESIRYHAYVKDITTATLEKVPEQRS
jgi:hypothetical protein